MAVFLSLFAGAGQQFFTNAGVPLAGGKIYTYGAGGSTPQATYTTSAGNIAHSNPIVLDAAGRVPGGGEIWLTNNLAYKFVLQTSVNVTVQTLDNIGGGVDGATLAGSGGSALVGFIQAGSGAVLRTAQSKMRDVISVKDFGAVGDGVTDDTAAIQAALDACPSGGQVELNNGVYAITAQLTVPISSITLDGRGATIKAKNNTSFEYMLLAQNLSSIVVKNVTFDANKANRVSGQNVRFMGAAFLTCSDSAFINCTAKNCLGYNSIPGVGLAAAGQSVRCRFEGCSLIDCGGNSGTDAADGIFTSGNSNVISNCISSNCTDTAFVIESSNDSIITGCASYGSASAAAISNASSDTKYANVIDGLTVINWKASNTGGIGITVPTATVGNLIGTIVSNVTMYAELGGGFGVGAAINVRSVGSGKPIGTTISGCRILNATTQGILVLGEQTTIVGCHVAGTTDACIQFNTGSISNNVVGNTLLGGAFGISAIGTATVTANANLCQGNGYGIYAFDTSTISAYMNSIVSPSTARYGKDGGASFNMIGLLGDAFMLDNFVGSGPSGALSDKFPIYDRSANLIGFVPVYNA
jgi:hypothetical protein